jgi:hypothetical protein
MKVQSWWRLRRDSSDDEIVFQYRATAEATCLNWPTFVKQHDASAMAMENQHDARKNIGILCL